MGYHEVKPKVPMGDKTQKSGDEKTQKNVVSAESGVSKRPTKSRAATKSGATIKSAGTTTLGTDSEAMPSHYKPPQLFVDPRYMAVSVTTKGNTVKLAPSRLKPTQEMDTKRDQMPRRPGSPYVEVRQQ